MESPNSQAKMDIPCWKKKSPESGFVTNFKDHLDEFVSTSMDQHRICLKKSYREVRDYLKLKRQGLIRKSSNTGNENELAEKGGN